MPKAPRSRKALDEPRLTIPFEGEIPTDTTAMKFINPNMKPFYNCILRGCRTEYKTTNKQDAVRHVLAQFPENDAHCPYCSYRTPQKGNIATHITTQHPGRPRVSRKNRSPAMPSTELPALDSPSNGPRASVPAIGTPHAMAPGLTWGWPTVAPMASAPHVYSQIPSTSTQSVRTLVGHTPTLPAENGTFGGGRVQCTTCGGFAPCACTAYPAINMPGAWFAGAPAPAAQGTGVIDPALLSLSEFAQDDTRFHFYRHSPPVEVQYEVFPVPDEGRQFAPGFGQRYPSDTDYMGAFERVAPVGNTRSSARDDFEALFNSTNQSMRQLSFE